MKRKFLGWLLGFVALCISWGNVSASEVGAIKSSLEGGKTRAALKKADAVLLQVISLKIKAQARLTRATEALRTYEVLVSLTGKENLPLLRIVGWAFMMKILQSPNLRARQMVAKYLGTLGDAKAITPLLRLLRNSKDSVTQRYAAEALGALKATQAVAALKKLLKARSFLVKSSAGWALGNIGNEAGVKSLQKCFKTGTRTGKLRCAYLLARLKKTSVRSYLLKQLKTNKSRRAREVIAKGLAALGNGKWRRVVEKDLGSSSEETRMISARVLGLLKSRKSRRSLQRRLSDSSLLVKVAAARSLGQLGSFKGTDVLVTALTNNKSSIRAEAASALADVRSSSAQAALRKALSDSHLLVRVQAAHALAQMKQQDGGGALREALARGNLPLQALAAQYAIEASKQGSLRGVPLARMVGELPAAQVVKAMEDTAGVGDDDDDDDNAPSAKRGKARKVRGKAGNTRRPQRRKPPRRRSISDDDDDDDDF